MKNIIIFVPMNYELIEDDTLISITQKLKDLIPGWPKTIADKMSSDKQWKIYSNKKCTDQIVTNIASVQVLSQLHRRLFVKYANEILVPVIEQQQQAVETAKNIS